MRKGGTFWVAASALVLASCGGGGPSSSGGATGGTGPTPTPTPPPAGQVFSVPAAESLSSVEVGTIIAQAAAEVDDLLGGSRVQQDHKFVPAQASHDVAGAHGGAALPV